MQRDMTQHNQTQVNTIQHNTTQHNTLQHNTPQRNTTQHNAKQHIYYNAINTKAVIFLHLDTCKCMHTGHVYAYTDSAQIVIMILKKLP